MNAPRPRNLRRRRLGLSLAEVLISLAISATLLTAIAAAFSASSQVIEANDHVSRATQAARVTMNQIVTEIRRCKSVAVNSTSIDIVTESDEARIYAYDSVKKEMTVTFPDIDPNAHFTLARNVFAPTRFVNDGTAIALTMTVKVAGSTVTLTGTGLPRYLMTFN